MVADVRITNAEDFYQVAKAIRGAGKDARKKFHRALNRSTKPVRDAMKANADVLPQRGGLSDRVRRARYSTKVKGGANPGVQIVVKDSKGRSVDLNALDAGLVRHPTYGRAPWVVQQVAPRVLTDPFLDNVTTVRDELLTAVDEIAREITQ